MANSERGAKYRGRRRWTVDDAHEALAALATSGLSVRAFAAREGLHAQRLLLWRRRLRSAVEGGPKFLEVRAAAEPIEVALRSGRVVRVPAAFDAEALVRLVEVLERAPGC
jgi:transposase-like protein